MTASVVAPVDDLVTPSATTRESRHPALVVAVLAATAGLVLRLWPRGPLWLDEAQSVAFARLPLTSIPHGLREDGAPPLYYLVLHVWMRVFGDSDVAVRSLSIVASVAFIVVITRYALRAGGTVAAAATAVVAATTPYAVRYATEARMYALVALEVALGLWVLDAALTRPTPRRLVAVAVMSAVLLYTHYWSLYLLASVGAVLLLDVWRRRRSSQSARSPARAAAAIVAGGVLWLPWVPTFRYQAAHTGTPWARSALGSMLRITPTSRDMRPWCSHSPSSWPVSRCHGSRRGERWSPCSVSPPSGSGHWRRVRRRHRARVPASSRTSSNSGSARAMSSCTAPTSSVLR
jgi:uncharacterized membrane protein